MRTFSLRIAVSLAFALVASQAFAHAQLEKSTPPVGGTVTSPSEIRLEFSEGVEPRFSGVTLTSAGGATAPLGAARTEAGHQEVLIVPIAKALPPGAYIVHWHAVSVDTHHTQGTFDFTVQ
ncbi:MAG: copper homeostasis periplasmic binding protein CopC [Hyphomicrobiales bacterium]|nr:copper homeostasis periplasmic binding protein CopC [Hyphomicrobiales bacterium]MBV8439538.1 copper homeostasis periplasmic binding protein CopC [Hyphomicrobiales bacterium]